jgi:hypothetical protein
VIEETGLTRAIIALAWRMALLDGRDYVTIEDVWEASAIVRCRLAQIMREREEK